MPTPTQNNHQPQKPYDLSRHVLRCLRYLAERCDGAQKRDGRGFSKRDARLGRSLAKPAKLTPRQTIVGAKLARKYAVQLALGGLRVPTPQQIVVYTASHRKELEERKRNLPEPEPEDVDLGPPDWWYE